MCLCTNGFRSILLGVLYWYVWAVLLPKMGGYELEEKAEILKDGTSIIRLIHRYR